MKKILAILGMITCMIGLTACGASKEQTLNAEEQEYFLTFGENTVNYLWQYISAGAEAELAYHDILYNGALNLKSAVEDMGSYKGTQKGTVEVKDDEVIVNVNVLGTEHDAVAEIVINSDGTDWISISTNVTYSTGEKMEKAALNTLLGMGTVFVVLILISLIISAFGMIPKLFGSNKKADEKVPAQSADKVVAQIIENEELNDDLELVAVISAAIAAYEGSASTDGFVVRSIRKAHKK
ncbi:MAG: OadG family protein [Bacillus sp. (in: Bacteria)]|nr:OadG family protein [Bacillus sp. (in: firmicutes)]MCM1428098.1 OadG family protein [Eubacterium sp.]